MKLAEKTSKLLKHSLIIKSAEKKAWQEMLPKMSEKDTLVLYNVLVDEVRAWKKEGISIVQNLAEEASLLPAAQVGASVTALKDRLEGKLPPDHVPSSVVKAPEPTTAFGKELMKEVNMPELSAPDSANYATPKEEEKEESIFGEPEFQMPTANKNAWMLSNRVVVPKTPLGIIRPQPMNVPRVRNRSPKHGLPDLQSLNQVDDLAKVEAAHLRQGPLREQMSILKGRINELAEQNDMLPISILPIFEQSPLYQNYLQAGVLLIERNQGEDKVSLDQLIPELEQMGQDTLSQEEFEAVADVKKELETMAGM